jgi:hypothetical protein
LTVPPLASLDGIWQFYDWNLKLCALCFVNSFFFFFTCRRLRCLEQNKNVQWRRKKWWYKLLCIIM